MRKYNIIIVENDEDEQFFIKESFDAAKLFNIVAQVKNGDVLLEWLDANNDRLPDIILSDLNMPGKNGYDIITEIRAIPQYMHIPVVIMSTSSAQINIDKCMALGASHYILKPDSFLEYNDFIKKLYNLMGEWQLSISRCNDSDSHREI